MPDLGVLVSGEEDCCIRRLPGSQEQATRGGKHGFAGQRQGFRGGWQAASKELIARRILSRGGNDLCQVAARRNMPHVLKEIVTL
ncbi:hypothetical protein EDD27_3168 [Nonomuraea polychroma]|uniref:Uncharacterized protein n=1 Tax=Nonomuraea polychroma TaxID=46176 RepID=A0A438M585_9ACTN|nr:hypothetical protein EDD27_3168 [Nonomuraea polychroma]